MGKILTRRIIKESIKMHYQSVTTPEQSRRLMDAGLSVYSADAYLRRSFDLGYYPNFVPSPKRQLDKEENDRFFYLNKADLSGDVIIPAWTIGCLWEICNGANLTPEEDPFEYLVKRIILLATTQDIDPKYLKY